MAYEPDVRFNNGTDNYIARVSSDWLWNTNHTERDIYRYLIGIDYNLHCKWINPVDDITTSFQFSQNIIDGGVDVPQVTAATPFDALTGAVPGQRQRLQYAPYFWFPEETEEFVSLSFRSEYMGSNLIPAILAVADLTYNTWVYKAKVDYKYQNTWIFGLGANVFHGNHEKAMGLFGEADCFFASIKYLF